jgi:hypothetical protein
MKSSSKLFFGYVFSLYLPFIEQEDHILTDQLVNGYFLLFVGSCLLGQPPHHAEVSEVSVYSVRNEQVLDLLQHFLQHLNLLKGQLLVLL